MRTPLSGFKAYFADGHESGHLRRAVFFADGHESGHFVLGNLDGFASPLGEREVADFEVGFGGAVAVDFGNLGAGRWKFDCRHKT